MIGEFLSYVAIIFFGIMGFVAALYWSAVWFGPFGVVGVLALVFALIGATSIICDEK